MRSGLVLVTDKFCWKLFLFKAILIFLSIMLFSSFV